jgi:lipopolysaccharide/colanic/teichoic acid biosynthesis glycosyltransferase
LLDIFIFLWGGGVIKRLFDILSSIIGLVLFLPLLLFLAFLIQRKLGSPVFFRQIRPGKNGKSFEMIKFRTMIDGIDANGNLLADEQRITPFGNFVRSTSLDELPELFNVLKGDMSLIGPRPLLIEYLPLYTQEQFRRHEVRPGVTGWAQVNGRNAISWEEKFRLDVWYVDNQSFWLDIKILCLTVKKVLMRDGISADGEATMTKFTGTADSGHEK